MTEFEKTKWTEAQYAKAYRDNADHYIPERDLMLSILASFYRCFVKDRGRVRVLDLGCGDGIVAASLLAEGRDLWIQAVDGSHEMIASARKRLLALGAEDVRQVTFQELISGAVTLGPFDCVVSAFAIHHLDLVEKQALFRWVFQTLESGGVFVNLDIVRPLASEHEAWYYDLWRQWIGRHQREAGIREDFLHVPEEARARPENRYDTLQDQLTAVRNAGFVEVECHYRYGLFGVYSGNKAQPRRRQRG